MKTFFVVMILVSGIALAATPKYSERPDVQAFIRDMVERHGFVERELRHLFSRVQRADPVLEAISTPREKSRDWGTYRASFITERRIAAGIEFWKRHRRAFERAEKQYGVPAEYIAAIIGVETYYGRQTGRWRVVDALTTLAFDYPPRAPYFREELEQYLLLARAAASTCSRCAAPMPARWAFRNSCPAARGASPWISTATAASTCAAARPTPSAAWPITCARTAGSPEGKSCARRR
jgi:membrane-bound lytic murein transglycosylase B